MLYTADGVPIREFVTFTYTTAGFGPRARFQCPGCGQPSDGPYLGVKHYRCRLCLRLTYLSQYDAAYERARDRAHKLKRKCDPSAKVADERFPLKPKWMRWRTYDRMRARHDALMQRYYGGFVAMAEQRFGPLRALP